MPNKRRRGARGHEIVTDDDLWAAYGQATTMQGTDRTKQITADMTRYVKRHLPRVEWPPSVRAKKETP